MKIKALSLQQPYANLVAGGQKTLETRKWGTKYRGPILICASMSGKGEPRGVALCMVVVGEIRPMTKDDEAAACIALYPRALVWQLSNCQVLKQPFPVKGSLGLFSLDIDEQSLDFEEAG